MRRDDDTTPVSRRDLATRALDPLAPGALDPLAPGALVGDYVIEAPIASGGHGSVYAASHRVLGRRAAVKVLRLEFVGSSEMLARFIREARVVNRIRHPDIVDIYDLGTLDDGRPYCVMEFLEGRGLDAVIRERAPLAPAEAVALIAPVCRALQAAHEAGVVHRDVKASNVMVPSAEGSRAKLLDFGVAKDFGRGEHGLTVVGQRLGTPVAMAPEQIVGGEVDARADVYALGVLLFQMLTGRPPFVARDSDEVERMHIEVPAPRASATAPVPPALDLVIARAMEKSRERRWPSAAAFLAGAEAALGDAPGQQSLRRRAVALHVVLRIPPDPDDDALVAQADAADAAQAALRQAGFQVPMATAAALFGVRLLPSDAGEDRRLRTEAADLARSLDGDLSRFGLATCLAVSVGEVEVRDGPSGPEVIGGPACAAPVVVGTGVTIGADVL